MVKVYVKKIIELTLFQQKKSKNDFLFLEKVVFLIKIFYYHFFIYFLLKNCILLKEKKRLYQIRRENVCNDWGGTCHI